MYTEEQEKEIGEILKSYNVFYGYTDAGKVEGDSSQA